MSHGARASEPDPDARNRHEGRPGAQGQGARVRTRGEALDEGREASMAQATKWNPELQERMCDLAREGRHDLHICRLVGISDQTLDVWLKKGAEDDAVEPWLGFARAFREAQATGEVKLLDDLWTMANNSQGADPASLRWMLSKKNPTLFGDKTKHELTGADGGAVQVARVVLMPAEDASADEYGASDDDDCTGNSVVAEQGPAGRG